MSADSTIGPLRIVLFSTDADQLRQLQPRLGGMQVKMVGELSALEELCGAGEIDVLVVCGRVLPEPCWRPDRRPAIVWIAPNESVGPVDAILPPTVGDWELQQCIELVGTRAVLLRQIEELAGRVEDAFGRNKWRGGVMWRSPSELARMAITDPLTGVFNRRYMDQALRQEFERHKLSHAPLSVLLMDLDRFKPINDTWGHRVGDFVLCQTALRLQRTTRGSDLVCRYGGDEFAVLVPGADLLAAELLAERLRAAIDQASFMSEHHLIHLTCSLGIVSAPDDDAPTAEDLMHHADLALLAAKRQGGNAVCHWSGHRPQPEK